MGLHALETMFAAADAQRRAAFLPYYPVGYLTGPVRTTPCWPWRGPGAGRL